MYANFLSSPRSALALFVIFCSASIPIAAQSTPPREGSPAIDRPFTVEHGVALGTISPSTAPTNPGSILGDTVEIQFRYPNMDSPYGGVMTSGVVTPEGVRLDLYNNQEIVVFPDSVDLFALDDGSFGSAAFNGVSVRDVTNPYAFVAVLIGVKGNLSGFSTANVSESDGLLYLNYEGLPTPYGTLESVKFFVLDHRDAADTGPEDGN